jgi:extradiol dioxygenase family protein
MPFHLAVPVHDLAAARRFYGELLGCAEGRSDVHWVDFDFFGHQLVCHHQGGGAAGPVAHSAVEGDQVPVPHFGIVMSMPEWHALASRLRERRVPFLIEPHVRFAGLAGEQATLFLTDPSGNALEFKGFADLGRLFARQEPG